MSKIEIVHQNAYYKGYLVRLDTKDESYYNASFENVSVPGKDNNNRVFHVEFIQDFPMDLMVDMRNIGKGEYWGKIPLGDPELKIIEEEKKDEGEKN